MPNAQQSIAKSIRDQAKQAITKRTFIATIASVDTVGKKLSIFMGANSAPKDIHLATHETDQIAAGKVGVGQRIAVLQEGSEFYALSLYPDAFNVYLPMVSGGVHLAAPTWNSLTIANGYLNGSFNVVTGAVRYQLWKRLTTDDPSAATLVDDSVATNFSLPYNAPVNQQLLVNGGFETGDTTGWVLQTITANQQQLVASDKADTGTYSFKFVIASDYGMELLSQVIPIQPSTPISASVRTYKTSLAGGAASTISIGQYDSAKNPLSIAYSSDNTVADAWVTQTVSANAASNAAYIQLGINFWKPSSFSNAISGTIWIDSASLIGQSPTNLAPLYALKAIDANNNASPFSVWLQPAPPPASMSMLDQTDPTKQGQVDASGIATGTLRTFALPNKSGTYALTNDLTQYSTTFSGMDTARLVFRTDLGWLCYYDGTRWLTAFTFQMSTSQTVSTATTNNFAAINYVRRDYKPYFTRVTYRTFVAGTNNGTNFWDVKLESYSSAFGTATVVDSKNTSADSGGSATVEIDRVPNGTQNPTNAGIVNLNLAINQGSPGAIGVDYTVYYRMIVT